MKIVPTLAAVAALLLFVTWLSWQAVHPDAERFDRARDVIDRASMLDASLHRDVLSARAGTLQNYDPLVAESDALDAALARLGRLLHPGSDSYAALARLTEARQREESLVEAFKTHNALLQNSLADFATLSFHLVAAQKNELWLPEASALAGAMLRLTLNTSDETVRDVGEQLDALTQKGAGVASLDALLAHAGLLYTVLPETDRILRALAVTPERASWQALRAALNHEQRAARVTSRAFRVALYIVSLALVGLLTHLFLLVQGRARSLRRRAAFEHVVAQISTRFINTPAEALDAAIRSALAELGPRAGADRAYCIQAGTPALGLLWTTPSAAPPDGWPSQAVLAAEDLRAVSPHRVLVADVSRLPPGPARTALEQAGVKSWACTTRLGTEGETLILGFDGLCRSNQMAGAGELGSMRMALDAMGNALVRRRLEQEREELEARLQQARRLETVGGLASGIAHNFNNCVCAILGYAEMGEDGDSALRVMPEIHRAAERGRELIEQILTFARPRHAPRIPIDIHALVAEATSMLRASLPEDVIIAVHPADATAMVSGVHAQLQQVIVNLCNNAAHAIDHRGRIAIDIALREVDATRTLSHFALRPGRYVRIAVSDTGPGIQPLDLERIFEPFYTTRIDGTGLGLATARDIIADHGGVIDVRSEIGRGTQFEIWLPRRVGEPLSESAQSDGDVPLGAGERLLLIEAGGERLLRDEEILAALGYEPIGISYGEDLDQILGAAPDRFDAMILTACVPDALALAGEIHGKLKDLPILFATPSADAIDADAMMRAGISDLVPWPIVSTELAVALRSCLARRPASVRG